jgi:hypothetical protein
MAGHVDRARSGAGAPTARGRRLNWRAAGRKRYHPDQEGRLMGKQSKMKKERNKKIHVRNFYSATGMTPEQMHVEALNAKCPCGAAATTRAISYAKLDELMQRTGGQELIGRLLVAHRGQLPVIEFTYGKFVKIGEVFACNLCRPTMEREAAKGPSWVLVHIDRGPGPEKPLVQVPGN